MHQPPLHYTCITGRVKVSMLVMAAPRISRGHFGYTRLVVDACRCPSGAGYLLMCTNWPHEPPTREPDWLVDEATQSIYSGLYTTLSGLSGSEHSCGCLPYYHPSSPHDPSVEILWFDPPCELTIFQHRWYFPPPPPPPISLVCTSHSSLSFSIFCSIPLSVSLSPILSLTFCLSYSHSFPATNRYLVN